MSLTTVAVVWSVLSLVVAASFWYSLLQPHWFVHNDTMTSLGVYSYCYHDDDDVIFTTVAPSGGRHVTLGLLLMRESCTVYGGPEFHFSKLPSMFWQASCILMGSASVLASLCALLAALTLCLPRYRDCTLAAVTGYAQIIAGQSRQACFTSPDKTRRHGR